MEIVLLIVNLVFARATLQKKTCRSCLNWSVWSKEKNQRHQNRRLISWHGLTRRETMVSLFFHPLYDWKPSNLPRTRNATWGTLQGRKSLVSTLPEEKRSVSSTENDSGTMTPRQLWGKNHQIPLIINHRRKEHNYPLHLITNMAETPLTLNTPPNRTMACLDSLSMLSYENFKTRNFELWLSYRW